VGEPAPKRAKADTTDDNKQQVWCGELLPCRWLAESLALHHAWLTLCDA
jgi:hypothetical protein